MWEGYYIFRLLLWSLHSTWRHFHLQQNGEVLWRHHHFLRPYGMIISHYFHHCCMRSSQVHKNLWQNCHSLVILANSHSLKTWSFLFSQKKKSIFFFIYHSKKSVVCSILKCNSHSFVIHLCSALLMHYTVPYISLVIRSVINDHQDAFLVCQIRFFAHSGLTIVRLLFCVLFTITFWKEGHILLLPNLGCGSIHRHRLFLFPRGLKLKAEMLNSSICEWFVVKISNFGVRFSSFSQVHYGYYQHEDIIRLWWLYKLSPKPAHQ